MLVFDIEEQVYDVDVYFERLDRVVVLGGRGLLRQGGERHQNREGDGRSQCQKRLVGESRHNNIGAGETRYELF